MNVTVTSNRNVKPKGKANAKSKGKELHASFPVVLSNHIDGYPPKSVECKLNPCQFQCTLAAPLFMILSIAIQASYL